METSSTILPELLPSIFQHCTRLPGPDYQTAPDYLALAQTSPSILFEFLRSRDAVFIVGCEVRAHADIEPSAICKHVAWLAENRRKAFRQLNVVVEVGWRVAWVGLKKALVHQPIPHAVASAAKVWIVSGATEPGLLGPGTFSLPSHARPHTVCMNTPLMADWARIFGYDVPDVQRYSRTYPFVTLFCFRSERQYECMKGTFPVDEIVRVWFPNAAIEFQLPVLNYDSGNTLMVAF